ncbi:autoinducer binding domain-containing protein [Pseudomonas rubra]|uniref:Autoinducer binding domain-containing protein n=1 Tax=Pseudomonas rubra TaxID=2942627 RepID=A0ABT5P858_9PSED|nr:autoinducer binding domain-containing protein [Pseudomonas rubra]MDD1014487.1 autoinducer binding domain-containing protein [Pseudomonas rubra]MDD1037890.1 autoinducer binding domain-containing protein [Pseudomonas rubra]MDD1155323.1 autoinducer binding domain-containing protein [Pseudomonas rubra]
MPHWKEQQLEQLLAETDEQRMFNIAVSLAEQLEMEFLAFGMRVQIATQAPQVRFFNNYPAAWNERYQACNYLDIDPTVAHCQRSLMPLLWSDAVFHETPHLREEAKSYGVCHGWSQSAHDMRHNLSILSVARSQTPISLEEHYDKAGQTIWLCNLLHTMMLDRRPGQGTPSYKLSDRESEVLKWSAAGKTAADIACILSLSQSTVNFHIRSIIISKTNASNKAGAIAIAVMNGLI